MLPEWTPGPGAYQSDTDFIKKHEEKRTLPEKEGDQEIVEIVPSWN